MTALPAPLTLKPHSHAQPVIAAADLSLPYRLLVTGWRDWPTDRQNTIYRTLDNILGSLLLGTGPPGVDLPPMWPHTAPTPALIIMHGQSPLGGVDRYADEWARLQGDWVGVERHPPAVAQFGAGPGRFLKRNSHMVARLRTHITDGGYGSWAAFPGNSSGTIDCLTKAIRAGIPGTTIPYNE